MQTGASDTYAKLMSYFRTILHTPSLGTLVRSIDIRNWCSQPEDIHEDISAEDVDSVLCAMLLANTGEDTEGDVERALLRNDTQL